MNPIPKFYYLATAAFFSVIIGGCTLTPAPPLNVESTVGVQEFLGVDSFNSLVSRDVVSVLTQINGLSPANTTLGTTDDAWRTGKFADALLQELEAAGYAIRSVGVAPGTLSMGYQVTDNILAIPDGWTGQSHTVMVMAGDIAVRRSYLISTAGKVSPLGPMEIKGVDASTLTLNEGIFSDPVLEEDRGRQEATPNPQPEQYIEPAEQIVQNPRPAVAPVEELSVISAPQPDAQGVKALPETGPAPQKTTFLDLVAPSVPIKNPATDILETQQTTQTQNVMDLQQSNFEDLFTDMGIVDEKVLTFANDSTRMGDSNKVRLRELIKHFNAESDVFSVVGCSMGKTNYSGGQEGLARGRATRVRDELLYAGIPDGSIVEEGCWAEEAFDLRMPRRGVVITLKRKVG